MCTLGEKSLENDYEIILVLYLGHIQQRARCHEPDVNIPIWSCQTFLVVHQPDLQNHVHDIYLKPKTSMPENLNCVSIEIAGSYNKVQISI